MTHFETEDGRLCLLLSDGMGCGEEARRESALAVRLLERFLRAGVETSGALKTLNSALTLRAEVSESFTTIDLLTLSLRDGAAEVYKYGAAPSYVKRGARVRRITGSCLPAGLQSADTRPETTGFTLEKGSFFVMLSDGVADVNDDGWLMALLEKFQGDDPQALASAILAAGRERRTGDRLARRCPRGKEVLHRMAAQHLRKGRMGALQTDRAPFARRTCRSPAKAAPRRALPPITCCH